ncbi:effector-associated constant component EACC1 [Kitasatospora aureofaciens]|uniref:effector-associated constant component EACC1 n=1 Tax=Kitasatospora aureofaciens TaxID=1894 RepID=UPI0037CAD259
MDDLLRIRVTDADRGATASLLGRLRAEDELRGRVELEAAPPLPGSPGTHADVLTVAVGTGGAVSGLTSALIAWVRWRGGETVVRVTRADGSSIELRATAVHGLKPDGVAELVREVGRSLADRPGPAALPDGDE